MQNIAGGGQECGVMEKRVGCLHYEQGCACIITHARLKEARGFCIGEECRDSEHQPDSRVPDAAYMSSEADPHQPGFSFPHLSSVGTQLPLKIADL